MTLTLLVVGCGSIGTRHLRNLRRLRAGRLLATDLDPARRRTACRAARAVEVPSLDAGLTEAPNLVLVCTPPKDHEPTARRALEAGAHVFLEKPLADTEAAGRALAAAARRSGRLVRVGYNLRFEPGLARLAAWTANGALGAPIACIAEFGQWLPDWRPDRDYRTTYTARRRLGGGILLDASHEFDALRWLLGEPRRLVCRARAPPHLETDAEGVSDTLLEFAGGLTASVHLDFVQHGYERRLKVVGSRATALWDFGRRRLSLRGAGGGRERTFPLPADADGMYRRELADLLGTVRRGGGGRLPDAADALRTLRVALAARRSARTHRAVRL